MEPRALVDWAAELRADDRPVDDWTAGDDLDFTVRTPARRRITPKPSEHISPPSHPARRTAVVAKRPETVADVPRLREIERRRRSSPGPAERVASQPDRVMMWAVAMSFVLIVIASFSS